MITYWVKYKLPNQWFWRKINNIKEDGIVEETGQRWFFDKYNKNICHWNCEQIKNHHDG